MNPGTKVKLKRIEKGLTQQELGKKINISNKTILRVEHGEYEDVKFSTLLAISKALGLDFVKTFLKDID